MEAPGEIVMSGMGTLGVGGAIGPGQEMKDGYQGRPGTETSEIQSCQAALAARPKAEATVSGAWLPIIITWMRGASDGPVNSPPTAILVFTMMSLNWQDVAKTEIADFAPLFAAPSH